MHVGRVLLSGHVSRPSLLTEGDLLNIGAGQAVSTRYQMSLLVQQELDLKPAEIVWDGIATNIAAVPAPTNDPGIEPEDIVKAIEGKENIMSELNEGIGSTGVHPQSLVHVDGSKRRNDRSRDILTEKDRSSLPHVHAHGGAHLSVTGGPPDGPWKGSVVKTEPDGEQYDEAISVRGPKSLIDERNQLFSDSTDEDGDSEDRGNQAGIDDNVLGKRSRSPEQRDMQNSGKKSKGFRENHDSAPSASTLGGPEGYVQHAVKAHGQRHSSDWIESQVAIPVFPPGLEKLHRVFTSLNTACGFLQRQQLESSWQNVKQALQQLSGTDEVMAVEDVHRLAQLCPRMVMLSRVNGEGEDSTFNIELYDPSEAKNSEQLVQRSSEATAGRQISDTEARLIVERRQKAFQLSLAQLAQQLQCAQGTGDASEHGKHVPIQPAIQRHPSNDGHHPIGPAILALPTQNLVLTPPPVLSQQLQPGFISISNGYHGLPFPIQVQPTNAYTFSFPQHQPSNYAGYQLSSIPSTSQPTSLPAENGSHRAQCTSPLVIDLTEPATILEPSLLYHAQSLNKAKRRRSRNWDTWEVVLLVQAKKNEWERPETSSGRDRFETSGERWKKVEKLLKDNKVADRDAVACKNKWESLLSDYKAIKDWNRKTGNASYNSLTPGEKKAATLPAVFASSVLNLMDSFQGKSVQVSPPSVVDSVARNAPAISGGAASGGAASGGDGSGAEESGDPLPSAPCGADAVHESVRKGKKSGGGFSPLVAAFDRLTANMINIEKGRDERSERLLALENRKYELERSKFELQARKLEIEREDRRGLVRVLGNLAGAFHRMADKM